MKKLPVILFTALLLASCSKSPKDRLEASCKQDAGDDAKRIESCECIAEKLESKISEEQYAKLADALEKGEKNKKQTPQEMGIDQGTMMAFMGAMKECEGVNMQDIQQDMQQQLQQPAQPQE